MISPEDGNKQKFEDKPALSPTEEKQVPSVVKKKRPWIEPLLRGVAIVVSLIMGFACVSLVVFSSLPTIENPPSYRLVFLGTVALLLMVLVGVGCAVLFRSWWATLFVPVAFVLGAYVASYLLPLLIPITDEYKNEEVYGGVEILLYFIPSLVVISAFSGSYFGMLWKKREHITPSLPQPGVPLLQHMLAILILVVGGFAISMFALFGTRPDIWATPILAVVLLAFVCARLLEYWWAMLIVPLAFMCGYVLGILFFFKGQANPPTWPAYVILGILPALTGALLGILTSKPFATKSQPMLCMALLFSLGFYGVALGEAFLVAPLIWPNALQDNSLMWVGFLGTSFIAMASLLMLGSLISANVHWFLVAGMFLLSMLVAFWPGWLWPGWLFQSYQIIVTYGGIVVVVMLSLILLARIKGAWAALWRTLLVAGAGAVIAIAVLLARGSDAWRYAPNGLDVVLVSLGIGALILLAGFWFVRRRSKQPVLQG